MYQFQKTGEFIYFYDLSGQLVRKLHESSNAVKWTHSGETIANVSLVDFCIEEKCYNNISLSQISIDGEVPATAEEFQDGLSELFTGLGGPTEVTVYQLKTTLTDAQIKALPTDLIELVPAPGADKILVFHRAYYRFKITNGAYTNQHEDQILFVVYGNYECDVSSVSTVPIVAGDKSSLAVPLTIADGRPTWSMYERDNTDGYDTVQFANQPLNLYLQNMGAGNLTGGHAANTLEVTVFYSIVEL